MINLRKITSDDARQYLYKNNFIYNNLFQFRKKLGYCSQFPNLHQLLILEQNLYFSGKFYNIDNKILKNKITELAKKFEFQNYLEEKCLILSGWYKQHFMIARSILHSPKFLIFDEPTVGLDTQIRRKFRILF